MNVPDYYFVNYSTVYTCNLVKYDKPISLANTRKVMHLRGFHFGIPTVYR